MSYTAIRPRTAQPGLGTDIQMSSTLSPVFVVLGIGAVIGVGYLIYKGSKNEGEVRKSILDKEGSAGLARYEEAKTKRAAVEGGLNILSGLAGGNGGYRYRSRLHSNKKKSRRRTSRR